jgi:hypothetical protein
MRYVSAACEEANECAALTCLLVAHGASQHGKACLEGIENGLLRRRPLDLELDIAVDARERAQMVGERYADHRRV